MIGDSREAEGDSNGWCHYFDICLLLYNTKFRDHMTLYSVSRDLDSTITGPGSNAISQNSSYSNFPPIWFSFSFMPLSNLRYSLIEIRQSESKSHYGNESKPLDPIYAGWLKPNQKSKIINENEIEDGNEEHLPWKPNKNSKNFKTVCFYAKLRFYGCCRDSLSVFEMSCRFIIMAFWGFFVNPTVNYKSCLPLV